MGKSKRFHCALKLQGAFSGAKLPDSVSCMLTDNCCLSNHSKAEPSITLSKSDSRVICSFTRDVRVLTTDSAGIFCLSEEESR